VIKLASKQLILGWLRLTLRCSLMLLSQTEQKVQAQPFCQSLTPGFSTFLVNEELRQTHYPCSNGK